MREATQITLKHDRVKSVELIADKFQLTKNERLLLNESAAKFSRYYFLVTCCRLLSTLIKNFPNMKQYQHEMSIYFNCSAYDDVDTTIRLNDDAKTNFPRMSAISRPTTCSKICTKKLKSTVNFSKTLSLSNQAN